MRFTGVRFFPVLLAGVVISTLSAVVTAQPSKPLSVNLGNSVVVLPAPENYEEATTQFEAVKTRFETATPPEGDLLAGYLPAGDCELLRKGQPAPYRSWMLINVFRQARTHDFSTAEFARTVGYAEQDGAKFLVQPDRSKIKERLAEVGKVLSKEYSKDLRIDVGQPKLLGTFDRRPNVFSNLMLTSLKVNSEGKEESTPVLTTLTLLLVKQRIVGVLTYKKYESEADAETLMQLTTKWIDDILAAN